MTNDAGSRRDVVFDMALRGYNRQQVDEYFTQSRREIRVLSEQLAEAREENERLRLELAAAGRDPSNTSAHEEN
ncbi:MAG TPA: DivIVA domain-containing protein [Streptosporangiaceae bacterium]